MTTVSGLVREVGWSRAGKTGEVGPAHVLAWARTAGVREVLDLAEAGLEGELRIARELSEQAPTGDYFAWCAEIREVLRLVRQARDLQTQESFARLGELLGEPPPMERMEREGKGTLNSQGQP